MSLFKGCLGCLTLFVILLLLFVVVPVYCTSPAFTPRKKITYPRVVNFITNIEKKYEVDDVLLGGSTKRLEAHLKQSQKWVKASVLLTASENLTGLQLCDALRRASCRGAYTQGSLIFFEPSISGFLYQAPGVIYSINGINPNSLPGRQIKRFAPYVRINGNWYSALAMKPRILTGW